MTAKEAYNKILITAEICYIADQFFSGIAEVQKNSDESILKPEVLDGLWDMSLRNIAKILDTLKQGGGSLPDSCKDILF